LLVSMKHPAPELVTGLIGLVFIGAALASSVVRNRRRAAVAPVEAAQQTAPLSG